MKAIHVIPAYGRDYKSARQVREAWASGKDFQISNLFSLDDGRMVNAQDYPSGIVLARYKRLTQVCCFDAAAPLPKPRVSRQPSKPSRPEEGVE